VSRTAKIVIALVAASFILVVGVVGFLAGRTARAVNAAGETFDQTLDEITGEGPFTRLGPVTVQTVRAMAELTTVEVVEYTTVEKGNDRGWLNWAAGDKLSMFVVARIGAGVDLGAVRADDIYADPGTGKVVLTLPGAAITYVAVDTQASHVYDRDTGIFTKGDPDLERAARLAAEELLTRQALDAGLLEKAENQAVEVLTSLLTGMGYQDVRVAVGP
jgi:hypothetical protein